jgi:hypothetical protein
MFDKPFFHNNRLALTAIALTVLFLSMYLPFLDKAFHIDDVYYIKYAKMIGWNPLVAYPADFLVLGVVLRDFLPYEMHHPLLVPYYIKVTSALFGESETALHASFLIFPATVLFCFYLLCRRFFNRDNGCVSAAIVLGCTPAYLVNSQNLMTDIPTIAFMILAFLLYDEAIQRKSNVLAYMGGFAISAALFTSYHIVVLLPCVFFYALYERRLNRHIVISLVIPCALLLGCLLLIYQRHDIFPILKSNIDNSASGALSQINSGLTFKVLIDKAINNLALIGTVGVFILPLYHMAGNSFLRFMKIFFPLCVITFLALSRYTGYDLSSNLLLSVITSFGALTLFEVLRLLIIGKERLSRGRRVFLLVWIMAVLGYSAFVFPFGAGRYLLPIFPPVVMVLFANMGEINAPRGKAMLSAVLFLAVVFGLSSSYSDYKFAETYRAVADEVSALRNIGDRPVDAWYIGEWGMVYYMEKAGIRYLTADSTEPKRGDLLVWPEMPRYWKPSVPLRPRLGVLKTIQYASSVPLRLFNRKSNAGFYCHHWGLLPFSFSKAPDETFLILQVVK